MSKIIKENDAIGVINYKSNINSELKNKLNQIIDESYIIDNCDYVLQIDSNNYKGDLMCLGSLFDLILDNLKSKNLLKYIDEFYVQKEYYDNNEKKVYRNGFFRR